MEDEIPENERWLHNPVVQRDLEEALDWAARNPPEETDLQQLEGSMMAPGERWLQEPGAQEKLARAIARAENRPFVETDLDELERRLLGDWRKGEPEE